VICQRLVRRKKRDALENGLRKQNAVESIFMKLRQGSYKQSVLR
jgi:hypothetical protein